MILGVKSIIASPTEGARVNRGPVRIHGAAWAGEAEIAKVELSSDGQSWNQATLEKDRDHYAWRLWSYSWMPEKDGEYQLRSRAADSQGRVQPENPLWNPSGYLYTAIDRVNVYVGS